MSATAEIYRKGVAQSMPGMDQLKGLEQFRQKFNFLSQ
jgi:hypothetical protein